MKRTSTQCAFLMLLGMWITPAWATPQTAAWRIRHGFVDAERPTCAISPGALEALRVGDRVAFELPEGDQLHGLVEQRAERSQARYTLAGVTETGIGSFVLAVNRGVLVGFLNEPGRGAYRVRFTPARVHVIEEASTALLDCRTAPVELRVPGKEGSPRAMVHRVGAVPPPVAVPDRQVDANAPDPVIDVLVVYTQNARQDAGGTAAMEAEIDLMMAWNDVVYLNSEIKAKMKLVYARALAGSPGPTIQQLAGRNDGVLDDVHGLRDAYGADQVAFVQEAQGGIALGLSELTPQSEATAFCINGRESAPNVLSHELGHNMGCCHALGQGGGCPLNRGLLFPFSTGHSFMGNTGQHFTAMAGGLLQHFSEPRVFFDGAPTGVFAGAGGHVGAENARTVTLSAPLVSTWRDNDGICEALDLASDASDCDADLIPDACEIALGLALDANGNSIPDDCEPLPLTDLNRDGRTDVIDIATLQHNLGRLGMTRPADGDLNADGRVDLDDARLFVLALRAR